MVKILNILFLIVNFNLVSFSQGNKEIVTIINDFVERYQVKRLYNQYDNQWFVNKQDSLIITIERFKKTGSRQFNVVIDSIFINLNKDYLLKQIKAAQNLFISEENISPKVQLITQNDKVDKKDQDYFVISYPIFSDTTHKFCFIYYSFDLFGNIDLYMKIDDKWVWIAQTGIWRV